MRRIGRWFAAAALLGSLVTRLGAGQTVPVKSPAKPATDNATTSLSREIHHQILVLPFYSVFDSINFTLEGHKVTLTGEVLRRTLKENAEGAVKSIEGVNVVVNQIEVLPTSPTDDDTRRALYRALYEDPTLQRYAVQTVPPVHIIVKNGSVALEGTVDSAADKNLAGARAGSVPNISGVKNDLVVHAKETASQ
jgi:hyperosmotically inducible periplasmic protein